MIAPVDTFASRASMKAATNVAPGLVVTAPSVSGGAPAAGSSRRTWANMTSRNLMRRALFCGFMQGVGGSGRPGKGPVGGAVTVGPSRQRSGSDGARPRESVAVRKGWAQATSNPNPEQAPCVLMRA
eukprot:scaffold24935_cov63-Phaeocystis_antarctica.AAC.4